MKRYPPILGLKQNFVNFQNFTKKTQVVTFPVSPLMALGAVPGRSPTCFNTYTMCLGSSVSDSLRPTRVTFPSVWSAHARNCPNCANFSTSLSKREITTFWGRWSVGIRMNAIGRFATTSGGEWGGEIRKVLIWVWKFGGSFVLCAQNTKWESLCLSFW